MGYTWSFESLGTAFWTEATDNALRAPGRGPLKCPIPSGPMSSSLASIPSPWGRCWKVPAFGLPIVAGTDVSHLRYDVGRPPGFALHAELAMLVAEGLTPLDALQAATLNPAKMLHATDSLGTVAPGKLADLVLLDADPLADITNTTTIRAVVANGRYFDRAALDRLIAEAKAEHRKSRTTLKGTSEAAIGMR